MQVRDFTDGGSTTNIEVAGTWGPKVWEWAWNEMILIETQEQSEWRSKEPRDTGGDASLEQQLEGASSKSACQSGKGKWEVPGCHSPALRI